MKKLIALLLAAVLCVGCLVLPAAAGETDWRLSNAEENETGLRLGKENEEATAYYVANKVGSEWTLSVDVTAGIYNGAPGTFSLALGTGEKDAMGLAGLLNFCIWNSDEFGMYQIWYNGFQEIYNGQWVDCNGTQPVGGDENNKKALTSKTFKLTVVREAGKNCLNVRVQTAEGADVLNFTTGDMEESVIQSVTYLGLRTWTADAQVANFRLSDKAESLQPVEPSWKLSNALEIETGLHLGKENEEASAYYIVNKAGSEWTLSADVTAGIYNGNLGVFSLALGTGEKDAMGLAGLLNFCIWNSDEFGMYQIWYNGFQEIYNGQWVDCNGTQPVGGDESNKKALTSKTFKLTVVREAGKNCLNVRVQTAEGTDVLNFTTGDMEESVMQSVTYLGLRTWTCEANVSNFSLSDKATDLNPPAPPVPVESDWRLSNAEETETGLRLGKENEEASAYYVVNKAGSEWTLSVDVTAGIYNGAPGTFSLALGTGEKDAMGLAGLLNFCIWNSDEFGMYQIWYNGFQEIYNGQWVDCNGTQPVGGDESNKKALTSKTFKLTVVREAGKNCLNVRIQTAEGMDVLNFTTGDMEESVMQSVTYLGLRTWTCEANVSNFSLSDKATDLNPPAPPVPVESDWRLQNAIEADDGVDMGKKNEEAYAYYVANKAGSEWTLSADVTANGYNGDLGVFSLALGTGEKDAMGLAGLLNFCVWSSDQFGMYQIWYNGFQEILNGQWVDCNGTQPVGGDSESNKKPLTNRTFKLTVAREAGKNCLHVLIRDAEGKTVLNFLTGDMDAALLNEVTYLGVRTWSAEAKVRSFRLSDSGAGVPYPERKMWKLDNATANGSNVSLGGQDKESMAYCVASRLADAWVMSADVNADTYNGGVGRFSIMLGSGDAENVNLVALLNLNTWNSDQYKMYQVWYAGFQQLKNGQWSDHNGSEPAAGAEKDKKALTSRMFKLIVEKKQGENFLRVIIKNAQGDTVSRFMTGELDADVMNSVSYVGLRTYNAKAEVSNFSVGSDYPTTGDGVHPAWFALAMLLSAAALLALLSGKKRAARHF